MRRLLAALSDALVSGGAAGRVPIRRLSECPWSPPLGAIALFAYLIPTLVAAAVFVPLASGVEKIRKKAGWKAIPIAGLLKRFRAARDSIGPSRPVPGSTVPTLVLTNRFDEPIFDLQLLSFATDSVQWVKARLTTAVFMFGYFLGGTGGQGCRDLAASVGVELPFELADAVSFGIKGPIIGFALLIFNILLAVIVEAVWIPVVLIPLHLIRGSQALSEWLRNFGLSRMAQSGFGENFRQTLFETTRVSRVPSNTRDFRFQFVRCPRREGLFHSGICWARAVFRAIFEFMDNGCRTRDPEEEWNSSADEIWRTDAEVEEASAFSNARRIE